MDPNVQGSFIPKQALAAQARGGGIGLFFLVALIIFIMSIVAAVGAFAYTFSLNKSLADKADSLQRDEGAFDPAAIQDLLRLDSRIEQAKLLLKKHVSTSAIFTLLSQLTLQKVQLSSMTFTLNPDGSGTIALSGSADSFSTVALQSDAYGGSKVLRDVIFSGISVGDTGRVGFTVNASVDDNTLLYINNLSQTAPVSSPNTTQTQGTTTKTQ